MTQSLWELHRCFLTSGDSFLTLWKEDWSTNTTTRSFVQSREDEGVNDWTQQSCKQWDHVPDDSSSSLDFQSACLCAICPDRPHGRLRQSLRQARLRALPSVSWNLCQSRSLSRVEDLYYSMTATLTPNPQSAHLQPLTQLGPVNHSPQAPDRRFFFVFAFSIIRVHVFSQYRFRWCWMTLFRDGEHQ